MIDRAPYLILFVLASALCMVEYQSHEETASKLRAVQAKYDLLEHVAGTCNDQLVQTQAYQGRVAFELAMYSNNCRAWIRNQTTGGK